MSALLDYIREHEKEVEADLRRFSIMRTILVVVFILAAILCIFSVVLCIYKGGIVNA